jgi:hypothetical protein
MGRFPGQTSCERISPLVKDTTIFVTLTLAALKTLTRALLSNFEPDLKARTSALLGSSNWIVSKRVSGPYGGALRTIEAAVWISSRVRGWSG